MPEEGARAHTRTGGGVPPRLLSRVDEPDACDASADPPAVNGGVRTRLGSSVVLGPSE